MLAFPIEGFSNYYVTDTGLVYSRNYNNTGRLKQLKQSQIRSGYFIVRFYYWWGTRPDVLAFGQAIEQWKKIEKQQKQT